MLPCACSASKQPDTYAPTGGRPAELTSFHVKQGNCHPELCPPHRPPNLPTATAHPAKLMSLRVKQDNYYVDLVPLRPSNLSAATGRWGGIDGAMGLNEVALGRAFSFVDSGLAVLGRFVQYRRKRVRSSE